MLEKLASKAQTTLLVLMVASICLVFILQFGGPQAEGCTAKRTQFLAEVYGDPITEGEYRAGERLAGFDRYPEPLVQQLRLRELVLEGLVERKLLAREARRLGLRMSEDQVMSRFVEEGKVYLSLGVQAPAGMQSSELTLPLARDDKGAFDKEAAKRFIQFHLRRSVGEFADAQVEEALAYQMRSLIAASVDVSTSEIWEAFRRERDKATLSYLRFSPQYFADNLKLDEAKLEAWSKKNQSQIDQAYAAQKTRFTKLEKQVRARHILIKAENGDDDAAKAKARATALSLMKQAKAGADFASLAKAHSQDQGSARKGGDLGFNPKGRMVEAFDKVQFALKPGEISEPVESEYGFHIIRVEALREGDVPVTEAKRELAEELYRKEQGKAMATQAAKEALKALKSGKSLETIASQYAGEASKAGAGKEDAAESDPLAPGLQTTEPFGWNDNPIPGAADSAPLLRAAFSLSEQKPLPNEPLKLGEDYLVYRLKERTRPQFKELTEGEKARLAGVLRSTKEQHVLQLFVARLRAQAKEDGALRMHLEPLYAQRREEEAS